MNLTMKMPDLKKKIPLFSPKKNLQFPVFKETHSGEGGKRKLQWRFSVEHA
jgi:hypothetical protein